MSLRAVNISVKLGARAVLCGVSLEVSPGELVAVVGPNGAGKTTLLRALAGDLAPASGGASLDGRSLRSWASLDLARRRAVLPQKPSLGASFTIREVVELGRFPHEDRGDDDSKAAARALATVGLGERADDPYTQLSGGEQQRVMVARVLAQLDAEHDEPRYLLLDEPTTALDLAWQHRLLRLTRELTSAGVGVLAVLHDLTLAATYADRVALLVDGRLEVVGETSAVLTETVIERVYGVRATIVEIAGSDLRLPLVIGGAPPPSSPARGANHRHNVEQVQPLETRV